MTSNTIKLGLDRIHKVLECLSNPHLKIPIIHVAGTNAKGSVCAFEAEILKSSGFKVGRFTSPYLLDPTDSINLNGENVDKQTLEETQTYIQDLANRNHLELSSFELLTAAAFQVFSKPRFELDLAVIEVGLGGATDATNVCHTGNTLFSCITPISIDHQAFLGSTVEAIATQKAGIAKPHVPILLAQQSFPEVREIVCGEAHSKACDVFFARPYQIPNPTDVQLAPFAITPMLDQSSSCTSSRLAPHSHPEIPNVLSPSAGFQHQNAVTAATLAHLLRTHPHPLKLLPSLSKQITNQSILEGLKRTRWPGRLQSLTYKSRDLLLDGAHNQASAELLGNHLAATNRPITLIISLSSPRDPQDFIKALNLRQLNHPVQVIATGFSAPKLMQWVIPVCPELIANQCRHQILGGSPGSNVRMTNNIAAALELAISTPRGQDELIVVCGSLYLISDALKIIKGHNADVIPKT